MTAVVPKGAKASDWIDVGTQDGAWRTVSRRRYRKDDDTGRSGYVEAEAAQNADGSLEHILVRAQLDVWQHHVHHYWDHELTPAEARMVAARLTAGAAELTELSLMFTAAAEDVERWTR